MNILMGSGADGNTDPPKIKIKIDKKDNGDKKTKPDQKKKK